MKTALRTDVGCVRQLNEDAAYIGDGFSILCDGMGGHSGGEVASNLAVDIVNRELSGKAPSVATLLSAVQQANDQVHKRAMADKRLSGMGTTLTALWADKEQCILAQVGDSRAYLYRKGTIRQCTHDHSLVAEMMRSGVLTKEEARTHPNRNVITRSLGTDPHVAADIFEISRKKGDRWLLCSDGLTAHLDDQEIEKIMRGETLHAIADELLGLALSRGGVDNITLILLEDDGGDA